MKILIIEDDKNVLSFLTRGFEEDGYILDSATDGEEGEYLTSINNYDVIVLDWMLPLKSGIEVLKSLRFKHIITPILMLPMLLLKFKFKTCVRFIIYSGLQFTF